MADEKEKEQKTPAAGEGTTPPADTTKTPPAAAKTDGDDKAKKVETKVDDKEKTPKPGEGEGAGEKKRVQLKDDEDIPEDADLIELSSTALKKRLGRATKKELKMRFGTDDFDEIKEKLEKLSKFEAAEEERKRQEMSEKDRYESDLKRANDRAEKAERRLAAVYDERVIGQEESRIHKIAEEAGMDPDYIEDQFGRFAKWLNENYSPKEMKKLKDSEIKKWFVERLKAKPRLAKDASTDTKTDEKEQQKPEVRKVGANNGAGGRPPPPDDKANANTEKTFKPGQKNSMSPQEAKREMAKMGIRY